MTAALAADTVWPQRDQPDGTTYPDWMAEGIGRFGKDPLFWRFTCVACGTEYQPADFQCLGAEPRRAPNECIGRVFIEQRRRGERGPVTPRTKEPGCDVHAGGSLLRPPEGVVKVVLATGAVAYVMPFAAPTQAPPSRT